MRKIKRMPLSQETGDKIISYLNSVPEWFPTPAPQEIYDLLGLVRKNDSLGVMISGSSGSPQLAHLLKAIILGMDVLAIENNPRVTQNEPPGNAYHYVIQKINHPHYPYLLYGPFKVGTIVPHWFSEKDLDSYWQNNKDD